SCGGVWRFRGDRRARRAVGPRSDLPLGVDSTWAAWSAGSPSVVFGVRVAGEAGVALGHARHWCRDRCDLAPAGAGFHQRPGFWRPALLHVEVELDRPSIAARSFASL